MRSFAAVLIGALALAMTASAEAANNTRPATATDISAGVPFSGNWETAGCCTSYHWYRPTFPLRTGDAVQMAIDNTDSPEDFDACFVGPVDEFGADEALTNDCVQDAHVSSYSAARNTLVYDDDQPNGFLVIVGEDDEGGQYTVTIEQVVTRVNVGFIPPRRIKRSFTVTAALRYGDNTPVVDGTAAVLRWRRGKRSRGPHASTTLAQATSVGGTVSFTAQLPSKAGPRVKLRACAPQPGGTRSRCTGFFSVKVR